jgi:hypothetical protein
MDYEMTMQQRIDSLKRGVQYGKDNGKKNMIVDLDLLAAVLNLTKEKRVLQPMQPVVLDEDGIARFQGNKIVAFLCDWAAARGMGMNEMAAMLFSDEDRSQFAQQIGYSVSGYGDLSYAVDVEKADEAVRKLLEKQS